MSRLMMPCKPSMGRKKLGINQTKGVLDLYKSYKILLEVIKESLNKWRNIYGTEVRELNILICKFSPK